MLPSSTSSSDRSRGRRWGTFAITVAVALAGAEAALRLPVVRSLLPPRTHFYHPVIAQRLDHLDRLRSVHERVDILFVGSSIVLTNVHPLLFDSVVGGQPGRLVSFNAGLPGLWPSSVHLYLEHLWLPAARPRVVVQGIRYAELAATTHAKNETQVWTGRVEPGWRDADLLTRLHAAAAARIHLLQYRGALTRRLDHYRHGWVGDPYEGDLDYFLYGYEPRGASDTSIEEWEEDLPNDGTCADGGCEVGFDALRQSIRAVHDAGSEYVLVNIPEHPRRWRGPGGAARYRAYIASLRAFAAEEGVAFVDPTQGSPARFAHVMYNDFAHMTAGGSRSFTRALGRYLGALVIGAVETTSAASAS